MLRASFFSLAWPPLRCNGSLRDALHEDGDHGYWTARALIVGGDGHDVVFAWRDVGPDQRRALERAWGKRRRRSHALTNFDAIGEKLGFCNVAILVLR